jgi:phospholipase/carboxylesterase
MLPLLDCVEVDAHGRARGSVIWLHGLGASGHDFEPLVPHLGLPDIRFVFPHAPQLAVTINGGMVMPAWYDIRSISNSPERESEEDIRRSAQLVEALIAAEEERGVPPERIVLAGFSQGAAMALHVGLRQERPLLGLLVLSGYLVLEHSARLGGPGAEWTQESAAVPVFCSHGTRDGLVLCAKGRAAFERLSSDARVARWEDYRMMHEVCPEQIADIASWLAERFDSLG